MEFYESHKYKNYRFFANKEFFKHLDVKCFPFIVTIACRFLLRSDKFIDLAGFAFYNLISYRKKKYLHFSTDYARKCEE